MNDKEPDAIPMDNRKPPVSQDSQIEALAREIAARPGNAEKTFRYLLPSDRRAFTNFVYNKMTKFERSGWMGDALIDETERLIHMCAGPDLEDIDLLRTGSIVVNAYLHSVESIYNKAVGL